MRSFHLVVLGASLVLVQSDAFPVQDPVMPLPLGREKTEIIQNPSSAWEVNESEQVKSKGGIRTDIPAVFSVKSTYLVD